MANTYAAPNFNIDTSTNIAGLIALKGGAPALTDNVYIYNGALLTVEQALAINLISLGETSGGAAGAGNRYGHLTVNAGVTVTFAGSATAANSGIKSNPASADASSKGSTLTISGTSASPSVLTNSTGNYNANNKYQIAMTYGIISAAGAYWTVKYANSAGPFILIPTTSTYSTATTHSLGNLTCVFGTAANATYAVAPAGVDLTINVVFEFYVHNRTEATAATVDYMFAMSGMYGIAAGATISWFGYTVLANATFRCGIYPVKALAAVGVTLYGTSGRVGSTVALATIVTPTGLALTDPVTNGELRFTITNPGSYAATDEIVICNNADDSSMARIPVSRYNAWGYGILANLANGTSYTAYARATSDNFVYSAKSATATATPTQPPARAGGNAIVTTAYAT